MKNLIIAILFLLAPLANAQQIEIVVPYVPGGSADLLGRSIQLNYTLQQIPSIVVNKAGAAGRIGTKYSLEKNNSETILIATSGTFIYNFFTLKDVGYTLQEFETIAPLLKTPVSISVSNKSNIQSLTDFIATAKTKKLNCGVSNSSADFFGQYVIARLKLTNIQLVPFKSAPDLQINLINGELDCIFDQISSSVGNHKTAKSKLIAVGSEQPLADYPNITTINTVIPNFVLYTWFGLAVPANASAEFKQKVFQMANSIVKTGQFKSAMTSTGFEVTEPKINSNAWLQTELANITSMSKLVNITKE